MSRACGLRSVVATKCWRKAWWSATRDRALAIAPRGRRPLRDLADPHDRAVLRSALRPAVPVSDHVVLLLPAWSRAALLLRLPAPRVRKARQCLAGDEADPRLCLHDPGPRVPAGPRPQRLRDHHPRAGTPARATGCRPERDVAGRALRQLRGRARIGHAPP